MAQTIKLKRSATQGAVPSTSALALGEIAINTYDGNLFIKKNDGSESIVTIGGLADNAVTSAKIAANAVEASEIATNAVGISELNVSDGTSGQILTTDGAGSLSFTSKVSTAQSFYLNSATGDGSTTDFSLSTTPAAESNIIAFIDGVFQTQDSYTFSGTTLSFSSAPPNGTEVTVYVVGSIFSGNSVVLDTFSGDDSTTQFTLSENPENENNTQVYIDGVYQQKSEYSVSSQTLTFSSAPPTGTNNIEVVAFSVTNLTVLNANSVSSASIAANAVTSTHIAVNQVGISELNLSDGTNGQVITTDGSGTLSFSTISGYTDSDVETYLDGGTSTPTFATATVSGTANFGSLSDGTITITAFADEDNMVSNSATLLPTQQSVKAYVDAEVAGIVDSAPGTLDTLNELAAALGDDANFSTTVTNSIATKLPLAGGTVTGNTTFNTLVGINKAINSSVGLSIGADATATNSYGLEVCNSTSNSRFLVDGVGSSFFYKSDNAIGMKFNASTGRVGIGTSSPDNTLHVYKGSAGSVTGNGNSPLTVENDTSNYIQMLAPDISESGILFGNPTSSANAGIIYSGSDGDVQFRNANNTTRMRIDSAGRVGIGAAPQTAPYYNNDNPVLTVHKASGTAILPIVSVSNTSAAILHLNQSGNRYWRMSAINGGSLTFGGKQPGSGAAESEAMRITSGGSVLIGTSTTPAYGHKLVCSGSAIPDGTVSFVDTDVSVGLANAVMSLGFTGDSDATSGYFIYMTDGNGAIGSIQAASGTSVSFNTTSDERLKTNIVDASPQLDIIKSIQVREFDWTRNDHHELGLIAQELVEIVPNVVTVGGEDETKNPYGVDYGKLTPYLIKAVQEQQALIEAQATTITDLTARIETLENA
jgi:hypothetical protein